MSKAGQLHLSALPAVAASGASAPAKVPQPTLFHILAGRDGVVCVVSAVLTWTQPVRCPGLRTTDTLQTPEPQHIHTVTQPTKLIQLSAITLHNAPTPVTPFFSTPSPCLNTRVSVGIEDFGRCAGAVSTTAGGNWG